MNEADIFHQAMLLYGGRFDIETDARLEWWRSFKVEAGVSDSLRSCSRPIDLRK
jgi:hypothetical protein